jgi:hypothetical protein
MPTDPVGTNRRNSFVEAQEFQEFLKSVTDNEPLWNALARRATVPDDLVERVRAMPGSWRLLVLLEDWCGDAVNTVPILSRLAELSPNLSLRVLKRDEHPALMDAHLTNGKRAIPVVMVLDEQFREVGWWGPRPGELQDWATSLGVTLAKPDRYREMRRWYAQDRGRATVNEVVDILCAAAGRPQGCRAA